MENTHGIIMLAQCNVSCFSNSNTRDPSTMTMKIRNNFLNILNGGEKDFVTTSDCDHFRERQEAVVVGCCLAACCGIQSPLTVYNLSRSPPQLLTTEAFVKRKSLIQLTETTLECFHWILRALKSIEMSLQQTLFLLRKLTPNFLRKNHS